VAGVVEPDGVDGLIVIATVVSALAALGALRFARDAVRETRALWREDRLARIPALVAELGAGAVQPRGAFERRVHQIRSLRPEAALAASGEELPHCQALARSELPAIGRPLDDVLAEVKVALDELTDRQRALSEASG
jgi:hypothetical protein